MFHTETCTSMVIAALFLTVKGEREGDQMSINEQIDKENMVYPYI